MVEYSIDDPLRIVGYVNTPSEIAEDLDEAIGNCFVLFSQETQG